MSIGRQQSLIDPAIICSAELSPCGSLRWLLQRTWDVGDRILWIMNNPSKADASADDPTILRCTHFTKLWGYAGYSVVNLYPYRSSKPSDCVRWSRSDEVWWSGGVMQTNMELIRRESARAAMVVAAWGAIAFDQDWVGQVVEEIGRDIYCLDITGGGAPKHPMARGRNRVPDDQRPQIWRAVA